jgi:hypothetical protein
MASGDEFGGFLQFGFPSRWPSTITTDLFLAACSLSARNEDADVPRSALTRVGVLVQMLAKSEGSVLLDRPLRKVVV